MRREGALSPNSDGPEVHSDKKSGAVYDVHFAIDICMNSRDVGVIIA
jgi:hypothetical protein